MKHKTTKHTQEIFAVPLGFEIVSRDEFFRLLYADTRDIMPRSLDDFWEDVSTREKWGWSVSDCMGNSTYAICRAKAEGVSK